MFCNSVNVFVPHDASEINANMLKSAVVFLFKNIPVPFPATFWISVI